jgi:uncharacterized protein (TIGR03083 family)
VSTTDRTDMSATRIDDLERIARGPEAWELATAAYDALIDLLDDLSPEEWEQPTVCEPWTVADVVRHLVGAAESFASVREGLRQQLRSSRAKGEFGGSSLDAWTGLHVRDRADLGPSELLARLRQIAPKAVEGRSRFPRLLGRISVGLSEPGSVPDGSPQSVTLGELNTYIYTRDAWLHRVDIVRAVGREPRLDPDVDGRIVEDVVIEWARRHGRPFQLALTGPAGGAYRQGEGGPELELDAVEFAWILSGRGEPDPGEPGADLLTKRVLF